VEDQEIQQKEPRKELHWYWCSDTASYNEHRH